MIAQNIIGPSEVCPNVDVFYRITGNVQIENEGVCLNNHAKITTDTYMNIFDAAVWGKYTDVNQWKLHAVVCGNGMIDLVEKQGDTEALLKRCEFCSTEEQMLQIPFTISTKHSQYYIRAKANTNICIKNVFYAPDEQNKKREIHIGVVICTYKRNDEVYRTLEVLKKSSFFQKDSELYGKLSVRIVDNASELPILNEKSIKLFHNKNTGGSGGFTRGILETRKDAEQYNITNVVLMDDDVEIIPETFYRLYTLLSLMKCEYQDEVIAGRMFRLEQRHMQYTAAEIWNKGNIRHVGFERDMRTQEGLIGLNDNSNAEYSGWWLACFPINFVQENTPLPFFLHCDDVEYGLRHGGNPIIMNGFQVWHESFENRISPVIEYYDTRNPLVVNAIYYPDISLDDVLTYWKGKISERHAQGNFKSEFMIIHGMRDFLRGNKMLETTGRIPESLTKKTYKKYINSLLWRVVQIKLRMRYKKTVKSFKNGGGN